MSERSILVVGETLVDMLPENPGALRDVESFRRRAGGAPANVAARLAALGSEPLFWTRVGDDAFGDFLLDTLADRGVPTRFVEQDPEAETTLAFVAHDDGRDRSFTFYRDGTADTRLESGTVPTDVLDDVEWVYVGGVVLATEPSRSAVLDLIERANDVGCSVYFDPNWRPELWDGEDADVLRDAARSADVLKATADELRQLGYDGATTEQLCEAACSEGPHTVFLTRGAEGSTGFSASAAPWGEATVEHDGFEVDVKDTTGAGDAFVSATLGALARGERDLREILRSANAAAAISATTVGAMEQPPSRDRVESFAAEREAKEE